MKNIFIVLLLFFAVACKEKQSIPNLIASPNDLHFDKLSTVWDEAIPLGNGMVGALVWEKEGKLRLSLDRADLWDLRPMENLKTPEWKFSWVYEQWKNNNYKEVQEKFDVPYDRSPAPSKIPGAALEFDISSLGEVESVHLYLEKAICVVKWKSGVKMSTFVHATEPIGWYRFEGLDKPLSYEIIPPAYTNSGENTVESPVTGQDLRRLGYPKGEVIKDGNSVSYSQEGWGGFKYKVNASNIISDKEMKGCWSISSEFPSWEKKPSAKNTVEKELEGGLTESFKTHSEWWSQFWSQSSIQVPDAILQKQWYLEQYKFGASARVGAPPISLQAVWTADNGKLPPWKGDFHHDLNTQLSYWSSYSGNHLEEEIGFLDWLWKYKGTFKKYTKDYYETDGLNVPGVSTLTGDPMGGWIQYSFGPTVSAWLGQHFYLHWRYSMDRTFLKEKGYPWIKDVAVFLKEISVVDAKGMRKLAISSSPEIYDNSRNAWFGETTNFDLSLIRWTFEKAAELAHEVGNVEEGELWEKTLSEWPELAIDDSGLLFAPGVAYDKSHRHFSHQLGYHPLGIIDFSKGDKHKKIIENTIATLDAKGSDWWVGYSFSWLGNLKARAFDGDGAAEVLKKFATSFCLPNSFHVNGDQSGKGYSKFKYRPFTLEGNFAFAAGLQEMLIQSHTGIVHVFPAVPQSWKEINFKHLRTEGAFLISATKEKGVVTSVEIEATKGGVLKMKNPFGKKEFRCNVEYEINSENEIKIVTNPKGLIIFEL